MFHQCSSSYWRAAHFSQDAWWLSKSVQHDLILNENGHLWSGFRCISWSKDEGTDWLQIQSLQVTWSRCWARNEEQQHYPAHSSKTQRSLCHSVKAKSSPPDHEWHGTIGCRQEQWASISKKYYKQKNILLQSFSDRGREGRKEGRKCICANVCYAPAFPTPQRSGLWSSIPPLGGGGVTRGISSA